MYYSDFQYIRLIYYNVYVYNLISFMMTEHSSPNQNGGLYIDSYSIYLFIY